MRLNMKRNLLLICTVLIGFTFQSCKDDAPVDPPAPTDLRDNIVGEYKNGELNVYNAKTGKLLEEYTLYLKVQKNSKEASQISFFLDGLYLFMNATNVREISVGYAFDIPEQEVKNFGTLKGKNYINVSGDTQRYTGIYYKATNKITIYMEKDNGGTADDYLYEFFLTKG